MTETAAFGSLYRTIFGDDWETCRWSMTRQKSLTIKHEILPSIGGEERLQNKTMHAKKHHSIGSSLCK
jgi:hypothetical protein